VVKAICFFRVGAVDRGSGKLLLPFVAGPRDAFKYSATPSAGNFCMVVRRFGCNGVTLELELGKKRAAEISLTRTST